MTKKLRNFRLEDVDVELLDLLADYYKDLHGRDDHSRTSVLVILIRKDAFEKLGEENVRGILHNKEKREQ